MEQQQIWIIRSQSGVLATCTLTHDAGYTRPFTVLVTFGPDPIIVERYETAAEALLRAHDIRLRLRDLNWTAVDPPD